MEITQTNRQYKFKKKLSFKNMMKQFDKKEIGSAKKYYSKHKILNDIKRKILN